MISNTRYWFLMAMIVLVYIAGMFVTLFENDSAQFAVMAMRMVQENDFLSLFKGPGEYLDKPHMHYWLAALSFKIFGLFEWAYRIPAILATLLGAYSCFGLGKLLYNQNVGKLAALIFMTSQTIVLGVIDVRTDAVLTGFAVFSIWHLAVYIEKNSLKHMILGTIGAGIAFSTKGQIALLVIGLPILCHLGYTRQWKMFLNWRVLVGLIVFALVITPMLYAYYHQFDLHPEKIIRGKGNRSGIFFIFWEQSFERLSGEGVGKNSSDYFFFFHTFLWVFLPWTVVGLLAYWNKVKNMIRTKFRFNSENEVLTLGGITLIFIIISFAQFKLPHYLNIVMPLFAVLSASYLYKLYKEGDQPLKKVLLGFQYLVLAVIFIATVFICFFVFKADSYYNFIWKGVLAVLIVYYCLKREDYYFRIITVGVMSSVLLNGVLNTHFYPTLLEYQAGSTMSKTIKEQNIPVDNIYKISGNHTWGLDFYNQHPVKITSIEDLKQQQGLWVYANDKELISMKKEGLDWDKQLSEKQFRITRLQAKFLDPSTRKKVLNKMHLIHIR
ncbi:ArnT family glycosyltransferase [Maribacter sp. HTCC2170]|uniref:ArnT family glycosyltransferase n=1 Tax=Maribacter sp. (strain HTCC2170 / KCCM 42371) TaxID=313603 RepID=UPI00006B214E|nr:glycosyltransferase family 39 protein [Maribacter sp. HTCC2170]EAR00144.1 dolichyl-phosphate-mannose-protein mannosyltransferase-family protein [Maribacter sp. HTCC2170]